MRLHRTPLSGRTDFRGRHHSLRGAQSPSASETQHPCSVRAGDAAARRAGRPSLPLAAASAVVRGWGGTRGGHLASPPALLKAGSATSRLLRAPSVRLRSTLEGGSRTAGLLPRPAPRRPANLRAAQLLPAAGDRRPPRVEAAALRAPPRPVPCFPPANFLPRGGSRSAPSPRGEARGPLPPPEAPRWAEPGLAAPGPAGLLPESRGARPGAGAGRRRARGEGEGCRAATAPT